MSARCTSRSMGVLIYVALMVPLACAEAEIRQVRVDLATKSSCGPSNLSYDSSCIHALDVRLVDADHNILSQQCIALNVLTLRELVVSENFFPILTDVKARQHARLEIRGYQSIDKPPCSDLRDAELMLWGASDLVDLTDITTEVVTAVIECRPDCACDQLGTAECPNDVPQGACTPSSKLACSGRVCPPSDCYGGQLSCLAGACTALEGGMCSDCSNAGDADCRDGNVCVVNTNVADIGTCDHFCAPPCPGASASPCPKNMSCKRLGQGDFQANDQVEGGVCF